MRWFAKLVRINLPDLGEGTKEATIKEWFVKEGQRIKEVTQFSSYFNSTMTFVKCSLTSWLQRSLQRMTESLNTSSFLTMR